MKCLHPQTDLVAKQTGGILICLAIGWWGIWSIIGGVILISDRGWKGSGLSLPIGLLLFGILCLSTVNGLLKFRMWARRVTMTLSVANVAINVAMWHATDDAVRVPQYFLIYPCAAAGLVWWYFYRANKSSLLRKVQHAAQRPEKEQAMGAQL